MEYKLVYEFNAIDKDQWTEYVSKHPNGNIFQTPMFVELYERTAKFEPIVIALINNKKHILGILVTAIQKEYTGILGKLSARCIILGGPLTINQDQEVTKMILTEFDKICRKKAIFSQFRNVWSMNLSKQTFEQNGYLYEEHLNILFDLKQGEEALWSNIHPTRRKQINRGYRRGVKTKIVDVLNPAELAICFNILKHVYDEIKLPYPSIEYFENAIEILSNKGYLKAALALNNNEIIGFRFFLCYRRLLYDWYAGSLSKFHDKYPNDILPWEMMKWGIANNYETFDFGGAGKPDIPYGVRDYKLKFGGELVNFGRFEKIQKPIAMKLARTGFKIWKWVKK
jgi:lipid II:glycine glycyltransferase (peptidoglycan interpeptide bridge formation enzyme)